MFSRFRCWYVPLCYNPASAGGGPKRGPFHAPQLAPQPLVEVSKYLSRFRHAEVTGPASKLGFEACQKRPQVAAPSLSELFPHGFLEAVHGLAKPLAPGIPDAPSWRTPETCDSNMAGRAVSSADQRHELAGDSRECRLAFLSSRPKSLTSISSFNQPVRPAWAHEETPGETPRCSCLGLSGGLRCP